jgi:hypothetical protein
VVSLTPEERRYLNAIRDEIDRMTPEVEGLTRTQILTLSACGYFNGAADAIANAAQIELTAGKAAEDIAAVYRKIALALLDGAA